MKTPDCMKNNPLSDKDVQLIADYCKEKRTSLFQYLLNEMKFDLMVVDNNKTYTVSEIRVCFQKHKSKRKLKEYAVRQRKPKGKQAVDVE